MDERLSKMLEDVRRMMEGAKTEGEANAAAAAFQRLIARHNLTEAEAMAATGKKSQPYSAPRIRIAEPRTPGIVWKVNLFAVVCEFNFCKMILPNVGGAHEVYVVGQEQNIHAAARLYHMLVPTFERISMTQFDEKLKAWKTRHPDMGVSPQELGVPKPNRTSFHGSFMLGVAIGLRKKLLEERDAEKRDIEGMSALVVVKESELMRAISEIFGNLVNGAKHGASDRGAFAAGVEAGKNYRDDTPISATTTRALGG